MTFTTLGGLRVRTTPFLTESGDQVEVRRPWRERLLTRPWRPWRATKTVIPQVPMKGGLRVGTTMWFHPATWDALLRKMDADHPGLRGVSGGK